MDGFERVLAKLSMPRRPGSGRHNTSYSAYRSLSFRPEADKAEADAPAAGAKKSEARIDQN